MKGTLHKDDKIGWIVLFDDEYLPINPYHSRDSFKNGAEVEFEIEDFWETGIEKPFKVAILSDKIEVNELDEFYYHEVLDRLMLAGDLLERHIMDHPVCEKHPELKLLIGNAIDNLAEAYLKMGEIR